MKKRLVIIPAFNEVGSIERTVEDIKKNAPSFDYVIINDHSMDGTKELCDRLGYNMVTLSINSGIGAAVQTGYLYGHRFGYDYAIQIDGDGQHDAKFLEKMADIMEEEQVIGADLRPGPLAKAEQTLEYAGCKDRAELRLGDGLSVLSAGEVGSIVLAGVSAQTTWEILEKAPWVFTVGGPRIIMIPATRHSELRRWLWAHGFAFVADRPVQAAGRWYAVMAAEYTGERHEPTFPECLLGGTGSWPEGAGYAAWQKAKLPRMRLGVPDGTPLADEIDRLLKEGTGL